MIHSEIEGNRSLLDIKVGEGLYCNSLLRLSIAEIVIQGTLLGFQVMMIFVPRIRGCP